MSSSGDGDSLSRWCVTRDLSKSIWLKNDDAYNLLMKQIPQVGVVDVDEIARKSESFPIEFPIETVKCQELQKYVSRGNLTAYINSVYPVIHEKVLQLCAQFLMDKTSNGSATEKQLYEDMDIASFVDRLLTKRAVVFMGRNDFHTLLDGETGSGKWETIGTDGERPPLILENCLSYDEIKISAYLSVSSYTHYLNIGNRRNDGVYSKDRKNIQDEGIIIGLIGPRFEKPDVMDYQDIVHDQQGSKHKLFDFFEEDYISYNDIVQRKPARFTEYAPNHFFDDAVYAKRIAVSFDTLLFEADTRAKEKNTSAYVHVVGIGLGVWKISDHQSQLFMDTCARRLEFTEYKPGCFFDDVVYAKRLALSFDTLLFEADTRAKEKATVAYIHMVGIGLGVWRISPHQNKLFMKTFADRIEQLGKYLYNINDVCFAYMRVNECGKYKNGDVIPVDGHPNGGIKVHIYNREPHQKLEGPDEGKLLVVSYAWDGNALPGNEFWKGSLHGSGDPAAACSTQVAELHNPHINTKVCGNNVHVVTTDGVLTLEEYQERVKIAKNEP